MEDTMGDTLGRMRRDTVEDTVKVPGFGFEIPRELWAGLEPLRRVSFIGFP